MIKWYHIFMLLSTHNLDVWRLNLFRFTIPKNALLFHYFRSFQVLGSTQRQLATALAFRSGCLTAPELLPSWVPRASTYGTASAPSLFPVLYGYTIPHYAIYVKPTFRRSTSKSDWTQYNKTKQKPRTCALSLFISHHMGLNPYPSTHSPLRYGW